MAGSQQALLASGVASQHSLVAGVYVASGGEGESYDGFLTSPATGSLTPSTRLGYSITELHYNGIADITLTINTQAVQHAELLSRILIVNASSGVVSLNASISQASLSSPTGSRSFAWTAAAGMFAGQTYNVFMW